MLVVCAAIVESPSEIFYFQSLKSGDLSSRMKAEGGSLFIKSIMTYILLREGYGLLAYSISWIL